MDEDPELRFGEPLGIGAGAKLSQEADSKRASWAAAGAASARTAGWSGSRSPLHGPPGAGQACRFALRGPASAPHPGVRRSRCASGRRRRFAASRRTQRPTNRRQHAPLALAEHAPARSPADRSSHPGNRLRPGDATTDVDLETRARAIHESVITIDTHDDISSNFATAESDPGQREGRQVTLPKMREGGLDVAFFIVYVGQTERTPENYAEAKERAAIRKFEAIHRLTDEMYPDEIGLALDAGRRRAAARRGQARGGDRNRERLLDRQRPVADGRLPRARRPLLRTHAHRAQRPRRFVDPAREPGRRRGGARRRERVRGAGDRRGQPARDDGGRVTRLREDGHRRGPPVAGADHRVALGRAGAGRHAAQPQGRRAPGHPGQRRRGADRGVRRLREDAVSGEGSGSPGAAGERPVRVLGHGDSRAARRLSRGPRQAQRPVSGRDGRGLRGSHRLRR